MNSIYNSSGQRVGEYDGSTVYLDRRTAAKLEGNRGLSSSGSFLGTLEGQRVYRRGTSFVGTCEGGRIYKDGRSFVGEYTGDPIGGAAALLLWT